MYRIAEHRKRTGEWVIQVQHGPWPTRLIAKAAWMRLLDPALATAPDEWVALHFDRAARNEKTFKVVEAT